MLTQGCPRVAFECNGGQSLHTPEAFVLSLPAVIMTPPVVPHLVWRAGGRSGRSPEARPGHTAAAAEAGGDERALISTVQSGLYRQ